MPELPEIHNFARLIQAQAGGRVFHRIDRGMALSGEAKPKWPEMDPHRALCSSGFRLAAVARGKELQLTLSSVSPSGPSLSFVFNHGLEGRWVWCHANEEAPKYMLRFVSEQGHLCLVDHMRMATWREGTFDTKKRGPDPLWDLEAFVNNIRSNYRIKKEFTKPIGEVLLDQTYFNGIGNYLRAEILARACVSPHQPAVEVFSQSSKADLILALCNAVPQEVLDQGLNKYGNAEEKSKFQNWLSCYGKAQSEKDSGGRTMWYFSDQASRQPSAIDLGYKRSFESRLNNSTPSLQPLNLPPSLPGLLPSLSLNHLQNPNQPYFQQLTNQLGQTFAPAASNAPLATISPGLLSLASALPGQRGFSASAAASTNKVPETTKLLMLISILFKEDKISSSQKNTLKEIIIGGRGAAGDRSWLIKLEACLEYFEAENDLDEVAETLQILTRHYLQQRA